MNTKPQPGEKTPGQERAEAMRKPTPEQTEAENRQRRKAIDDVKKRFANGVKPGKFGEEPDDQLRALLAVYGPMEAALNMLANHVTPERDQMLAEGREAEAAYLTALTGQLIDLVFLQRSMDLERIGRSTADLIALSKTIMEERQAAATPAGPIPLEIVEQVAEAIGATNEQVEESINNALQNAVANMMEGKPDA